MADKPIIKRLLDVPESAEYIGLQPGTIYNRLSLGTFPIQPKRIGKLVRFDIRDLDKFIDDLGQK